MSAATRIIPLTRSELVTAAGMAGRAFVNDPFLACIFPDRTRRERLGPRLLGAALRFGVLYGEAMTTPGVGGAAVWFAPGQGEMTCWRMLRSGFPGVGLRMRSGERARLDRLTAAQKQVRAAAVPGPHAYLFMLAVDPAAQGQGLGGALLRACLARSRDVGAPCYLETTNPANVAFYGKHGFRTAAERELPDGGPRLYGMVCNPGSTE